MPKKFTENSDEKTDDNEYKVCVKSFSFKQFILINNVNNTGSNIW